MAVAISLTDIRPSPTWRQFQRACGCAILALGVGCAIYAVETLCLHQPHRFVENPADTMTRAVGMAHFTVGWLFLLSSSKIRNRFALARLAFWTLLGIGFCALFAWGGADKNPLMLMAFYGFFFVHEVCDEAHLFRHSGELPENSPAVGRFLSSLCASMSLLLMTVLAGFQILRGHWLGRSPLLHDASTLGLLAVWLTFAVLAAAAVRHSIFKARALHGSLREAVLVYRPLLMVYAGISAILLVGSLFGSVGANLVILVHGMTWLVHTHRNLTERNAEARDFWTWLRQTPQGFFTLHLAATLLALILFALRTHVWQRTGLACDMLSKTNFPYWSIMHIATAFWRAK